MRDGVVRDHVRAAHIDSEHQIEPLGRGRLHAGQVNGARIVDQHVQTAVGLDGPPDAVRHLLLGPDVERDGKGFPSRLLHLFGRRMDRARQFRVRVLGLARHHDIGSVARAPERDGLPDPAACAGDQNRLSR